jgi:hypothetical protein
MRANIGFGVDKVIFGMSKEKIINIFGIPDKKVASETLQIVDYYYNQKMMKLTFDNEEDGKLSSIEVYNPNVFFLNQQLINKSKNEVKNLLKLNGYVENEREEYDCFETLSYWDINSEFLFEFGKLRRVQFSPLYDENDETIWPTGKTETKFKYQSNSIPMSEPNEVDKVIKIVIGNGIENLIFGMFETDVLFALGDPDKISDTEKEDGIVYYYNKLMLKVKFDLLNQGKLYSIELHNPKMVLYDQEIKNMTKSEIISLLKLNGYHDINKIDYETMETIFCKEINSTFAFEFDKLVHIEFSPLS